MNKTYRSKMLNELLSEAYKEFIKDRDEEERVINPEVQEYLDKALLRGISPTSSRVQVN